MRQGSNKTAKYKTSYRERRVVSNKGTMSTTLRSVHGPRPEKEVNVNNSTPDQKHIYTYTYIPCNPN